MNYGQVKAQFTGLMNRRDLSSNTALIQTFMDQAVQRVQRELRVPLMEKSVNATIGTVYGGLVIPSDFLELINLISLESNSRLIKVSVDTALQYAQQTGCPQVYAREGGVWVLGPAPEAGTQVRIDYYGELPALAADTDTNALTIVAWDILVYAALSAAADYYIDQRRDAFEQRYQQILQALQNQADQDEFSSATAVQPAFSYCDD